MVRKAHPVHRALPAPKVQWVRRDLKGLKAPGAIGAIRVQRVLRDLRDLKGLKAPGAIGAIRVQPVLPVRRGIRVKKSTWIG